ncbi:MAG: glycosyltransferase [Geminicoccaceae bacterium]|nr:MAG: glycosyltransferase [Geminicoccaceae bacterium]
MATAFYAPLKPPAHPVPSGDRRVARLLFQALTLAGAAPFLACGLRTYDRGDPARQTRLDAVSAKLASRLQRRLEGNPPSAWFTYHCYHKAPDGLGRRVSAALDLPYLIAEASIAPKRAEGPWAVGYGQALRAIQAADVVLAMSGVDAQGLEAVVRPPARLLRLAPFVDRLDAPPACPAALPRRLLAVAMLRPGAKQRSYALLIQALAGLSDHPWTLDVVGDGEARWVIEAEAHAALGARVRFHGRVDDPASLDAHFAAADAFVWPAVDEAYGMAILEAQARGLAVVAGDGHGVPDVVQAGQTGLLAPVGDVAAFRAALARLLDNPGLAQRLGAAASAHVRAHHGLDTAARTLRDALALAHDVRCQRR